MLTLDQMARRATGVNVTVQDEFLLMRGLSRRCFLRH